MTLTPFWTFWVASLTILTLILVFGILYWNMKNYADVEEGENMGHEFDGISEINNPLPGWWTKMFWVTAVWAIYYLAAYPGIWGGFLNWTSSNQDVMSLADSRAKTEQRADLKVEYDREVRYADEKFGPIFKAYAAKDVDALMADPKALEVGQRLYLQNCSQCHGSDARGGTGFPNLTDNDWLYGGSFAKIKETLILGRKAAMPGWEASFGEQGIKEVTAYVLSLSDRGGLDPALVEAGKAKYAVCAACHGADGKGSLAHNLPFGAPNLTDNIWLYGGSERAVIETLTYGRNGVMPAWKDILGEDKIHVISAYVYSLSNDK